jgi:hypothetical protein
MDENEKKNEMKDAKREKKERTIIDKTVYNELLGKN